MWAVLTKKDGFEKRVWVSKCTPDYNLYIRPDFSTSKFSNYEELPNDLLSSNILRFKLSKWVSDIAVYEEI